jgi:cystathionine beta-lyase/cystathionine gamma-synthase
LDQQTKMQHPRRLEVSPDNAAMTFPIYQSVKFELPTVEDIGELFHGKRSGFFYSRKANPTVRQLEMMLAEQQGTEDAIAFSSGLAAINCVFMGLLSSGDHLALFRESYMPGRLLAKNVFSRFGVKTSINAMSQFANLAKIHVTNPPNMVLFESPTNPMLQIADLSSIAALKAAGSTIVLDNTFAGPHQHYNVGADLYVHSLTKYVAGHGDVMAGAICGNAELIQRLRAIATEIGACLDPNAAFLVMRGMKTYFLRRERQVLNAQTIAEWLTESSEISAVHYPGLRSHPEHELALKQMQDFGAVVSFDVRGDGPRLNRFLNKLEMIKIAASLGSTETIIAPVCLFFTVDLDSDQRAQARITDTSVRLSLGIEHSDDIIHDIKQALLASR